MLKHEVEISNASSGPATIGAAAFLVIAFPTLLFALTYLLLFAGSIGLGLAGIPIEPFTDVESWIPVTGEIGLETGFGVFGIFGGCGIGLLAFFIFPRAHGIATPLYFLFFSMCLAMSLLMFADWHLNDVIGGWAEPAVRISSGMFGVLISGIQHSKSSASKRTDVGSSSGNGAV